MFRLYRSTPLHKSVVVSSVIVFTLAACGGGGGGSPSDTVATGEQIAAVDTVVAAPPPKNALSAAPTMPDASQPLLSLPTNIANGSVVSLLCGRTYQGTLNLAGKSNVTVDTAGACGKAVITPGQAITGWTQYQGNVYSAPIAFDAAQVIVDGQPASMAHWPNRAATWATATSSTPTSLSYAMPNADLVGAKLVFKAFDWAIERRTITASSNGVMTVTDPSNPSFGGYAVSGAPSFYVEGKLWMLDEPGEWAVSGGRLYVWAADGKSPEGRIWASPDSHAIEASNSNGVAVNNVRLFGAANGINANSAVNLKVTNAEIINSSENGIVNTGGSGLTVEGSTIRNSRHDGIVVKWGGGNESITASTIDSSGVLGMPTNARGAINLTLGSGATVAGNHVTNSGYIGIRFFRNAAVTDNIVDAACQVLSDCGALYVAAPDKLPLSTRISGNTISNTSPAQRLSWGLQMDDHANGVTVSGNTFSGNANGMMIFDGFGNTITGNRFGASTQAHIQMAEAGTTPSVRNNSFSGNSFVTRNAEETYRVSSDIGAASVALFGSYNNNTYASSSSIFANFNGAAYSFAQWKTSTGQDAASTLASP
ncbi:MAG: right-handed parallel beta-helix repeat-containing protein [Herminiimonas sp.]|nr:right-handed parallel beta-helix repeat-containing protein [Herminiimonas sp.]